MNRPLASWSKITTNEFLLVFKNLHNSPRFAVSRFSSKNCGVWVEKSKDGSTFQIGGSRNFGFDKKTRTSIVSSVSYFDAPYIHHLDAPFCTFFIPFSQAIFGSLVM
jgi:hypothetical protein